MYKEERKLSPTFKKFISLLVAFALVMSCIVVGIPSIRLRARADENSGNSGTLYFKDADIDYDSNLVENADGTYSLTLDFSSGVTQKDKNVSRTVSGDGYYVAPMNGYYTIQLWGGDGAPGSNTTFNRGGTAGKGGYVYTAVYLKKGDIVSYRLGGEGKQTLKTDEGGGVNGDGGNHGEIGSFYIGGGGGYSIAYIFKNDGSAKNAQYFLDTYTDGNGNLIDINKETYEGDRLDPNQYILVAGGGGGGGAGDRLNAEQIAQLIFNKPNGNADGGAGGSIGNATYDAIVGGNKVGTIYAGIDGSSSGKNKGYIGHGGTDVPGEAPEGRWQIIDAESPNNWDKSALADKTIEGGTGASGNLRGGGGGAGYTGGSGGMMTSLVNATNVGGGGGGASFVTSINPAVIGLDATELTETEKNAIKNAKNPREKVNNLQGGYIAINLLDEDTDDSSITWIENELSFSTEISKYFTIENIDATNVTVTPDGSNANKITLDKFKIATKGDSKVVLTLKPIAGFAGGNDVNIFKETSGAEIEADLGSSGQNLLGAKYDIDLDNDHAYVNVPLKGFKIKAAAEKKYEADQDISVAPLSLIDTANSVKEHGEPYDDFLDISSYKVNDADVDGSSANITTAGNYKVSFLVTPTAPTKATVGTPVVKTEFKATALISKKSPFSFNGVNFDMTKNLTYDASTNKYTYTLTLTTQDNVSFKQVNENDFYTNGVTYYNNNAGSGVSSNTFTAVVPGEYIFYALGGPGGNGGLGHANQNPGTPGNGGQVAGKVTLDAGQQVIVEVGSKGEAGDKASSMFETGDCGQGGFATSFKINGGYVLVAGGGGGGGGGAASGTTGGGSVDNSTVETTYKTETNYYNGTPTSKTGNTKKGGNAGHNFRSASLTSATFSGLSNTNGGAAKIVPSNSRKDSAAVENQLLSNAGVDKIDISVLDISKYFSDVNLANVNSAATTTIINKQVSTAEAIADTSYHYETTTGKVSKTWTFEFTPDSKFLGGYDVPVLDQQIVLKHSGTSETAKVTAGANASGVMTDYVNVKISDPKSLDTVTAEKKVIFGTNVKENELITVTGSYDGYDAEFVNVTDSKFATLGNTLPVDAKADETFTYKTGVAPKADSSVLANVGPTLVKTEDEAESTVTVIGYTVTQTLSNLNSTYTGTTVGLDEDIELTLSPKSNAYVLPDTITVKVGGETLDVAKYSYDKSSGKVSIDSSVIDAGVQIIATAADFVPEVYTFHLVYNKDGKSISQEFQYESGTALTANAIGSSTSVKAAMDAAKLDVGTASKGYTFVWDWPDGELSTMPAQDFWLFGSLEPYTYTMYADCECSSVNIGKATDLAWYTKEGAVVAPAIEGYILTSASNSIAYNINEAFIDSHANGAEVKVGTFTYKVATNEYTVQYVRGLDVETEAVNVANKPTIKAYDEYVAAKITVNGEDLPTVSFDSYTPADGDVVVITYKALLHAVTMIDAETGEELGTIQVEKGGFYNGLAKSDVAGKVGEWYYDAECTNKIHTRDSEFTKEDYANGTVDVEKDKIYVKWVDGTFIVTYNANGGSFASGVSNTVEVTYGSGTKAYGDSEVKRSGYSVKKWLVYNLIGRKVAEVNPGADISKLTEIADEELTLVAEWIPDIIVNATYKPGTTTETYASGTWTNQNVDVALSNGLGYGLDKVSYYYSTDGGTNWTKVVDATTGNASNTMTVSATGTYLYKIVATDGTVFDTESIDINIDKVAPTGKVSIGTKAWETFLSVITFGIYKNDDYTVKIEAQDETGGSGIKEVYYYVDAEPTTTAKTTDTLDGETWTKLDGTIEFTIPKAALDGDKRVAYARIVDNAGNVAYLNTNGVEFDYDAPVITVNDEVITDGGSEVGKGRRDVVVSDKAIDTVTITKDGVDAGITKTTDADGNITFSIPADEPGEYVITAIDKSGNEITYTITITSDDLKDDRESAKDKIDELENLTDEEKEKFKDEIDKADTKDEIDDILDKAIATDFVNKYCSDDDGVFTDDEGSNALVTDPIESDNIDKVLDGETPYGELTDEQKAYVTELISDPAGSYTDYLTMLADAKSVLDAEKDKKAEDLKGKAQEEKDKIDGDENLTDEEKEALKDKVDEALEDALKDLDNAKNLEEIEEIEDEFGDDLDLIDEKAEAISDIEAEYKKDKAIIENLSPLTQEEKDELLEELRNEADHAIDLIEAVTEEKIEEDPDAIKDIVDASITDLTDTTDDAIAENFVKKYASDDDGIYTTKDGDNEITLDDVDKILSGEDPYSGLTGNQKAKINDLIDDPDDSFETFPKMVEAAKALLDAEKEDIKDNLEELAKEAIKEIEENNDLTDKQKEELIDEIEKKLEEAETAIDNADTLEKVEEIEEDFEDFIDDTLDDSIAQAFVNKYASGDDNDPYDKTDDKVTTSNAGQIISGKDTYDNLTGEQKAKVNEIISTPTGGETTYNDYPLMYADATSALEKEKEDTIEDLKEKANEAKEKIDNMDNLSAEEKETAKGKIDEELADAIDKIEDAKNEEEVNKARGDGEDEIEDIVKEKAKEDIDEAAKKAKDEIDNLDNLSKEEKEAAKEKINEEAAKAKGAIDDAETLDDIEKAKEDGELEIEKEVVKSKIDDDVNEAKKVIDEMDDLTEEEKQAAKDKIDEAAEDAKDAIDDAETPAEIEKALEDGEDNLLKEEKEAAKKDIDNAAKKAKDEINKMENLSEEEKQAAKDKIDEDAEKAKDAIDDAETFEDIKDAVNKGEQDILDDLKKDAKDDIDNAAKKAKDAIDDMENLSEEEKQAAKDKIDEIAENAKDAIDDDTKKDDVVKEKNDAENDILDELKKAAKQDIDNLVEEAEELIDSMDNLTEEEKEDAKKLIEQHAENIKDAIDDDKTVEEIEKSLEDGSELIVVDTKEPPAKTELERAAEKAKEDIDNTEGLTEEQKQALKDKVDEALKDALDAIDDAKSVEDVEKAIENAEKAFEDATDEAIAQKFVNEYCSGDDNDPYDKTEDKLGLDNVKQVISGKDTFDGLTENQQKMVDKLISTKTGDETTFDSYDEMFTAAESIVDVINGKNSDGEDNIRIEVKVDGLMEFDNVNATSESDIKDILIKEIDDTDVDVIIDGGHVEIVMTIKEIDKDEINEKAIKADGNILVKHIEITIVKSQYGKDGALINKETITNTSEPISFVVSVGDYAKKDRVFYVYADHTGKTVAEKTPDGDGVVITPTVAFTTDEFSVFSIAYEKEDKIAQTLDNTPVILPLVMLISSAAILVIVKRKKDKLLDAE